MEPSQLLRVLNAAGKTIYRVQLPKEGRVIFLGWEPSGNALAAVQNLGGAFLWFPSKPDSVQQWEGMQFSSQVALARPRIGPERRSGDVGEGSTRDGAMA